VTVNQTKVSQDGISLLDGGIGGLVMMANGQSPVGNIQQATGNKQLAVGGVRFEIRPIGRGRRSVDEGHTGALPHGLRFGRKGVG
jgi:hypothetical protein